MAFSDRVSTGTVSQINITPLIDVLLVLLVIFIMAVPAVTQPLPANLPAKGSASESKPMQLQLIVADDGGYRLDDRPLSDEALWQRLEEATAADPRTVLRIRATAGADYQRVATALAGAREHGVDNIGLQP